MKGTGDEMKTAYFVVSAFPATILMTGIGKSKKKFNGKFTNFHFIIHVLYHAKYGQVLNLANCTQDPIITQ